MGKKRKAKKKKVISLVVKSKAKPKQASASLIVFAATLALMGLIASVAIAVNL